MHSDPVLAAALNVTMTAASGDQLAYVALTPETIDAGSTATITDRASGVERSVSVVNGGFDPVAMPATTGDTLVVRVATTAGEAIVAAVVARPHPPHVVRVDPPKDQVDVPVNTHLTIVFSKPVNAVTLTSATVQLREGATAVPGAIAVDPATPWLVTFTPDQPLVAGATYTLAVTGAIADPTGLTLDTPTTISFTIADAVPVGSIVVTPDSIEFTGKTQLVATVRDAAGNLLTGRSITWLSSDTNVASVDSTGLVTAVPQVMGSVSITATVGGHTASAALKIDCADLALECVTGVFASGVRTISGTISQMMPDGRTQPAANATYFLWFFVRNIPRGTSSSYVRGPRQTDANGHFTADSVQDGRAVATSVVGFDQPCAVVANTIGRNAVMNITVVDPAHPLPQFATGQPVVSGTVSRTLVDGTIVPVIGAAIMATSGTDFNGDNTTVALTHSDSSGRFALCSLPFTDPYYGPTIQLWTAKSASGPFTPAVQVTGPGAVDIIVP
ncbi:MAG TPA: Ig-like domain-containing protein [Gemmatimonadales bacterium]